MHHLNQPDTILATEPLAQQVVMVVEQRFRNHRGALLRRLLAVLLTAAIGCDASWGTSATSAEIAEAAKRARTAGLGAHPTTVAGRLGQISSESFPLIDGKADRARQLVDALIEELNRPSEDPWRMCEYELYEALKGLGRSALPELERLVSYPSDVVQEVGVGLVARLGVDGMPLLMRVAETSRSGPRHAAVTELYLMVSPEADAFLEELCVSSGDWTVRRTLDELRKLTAFRFPRLPKCRQSTSSEDEAFLKAHLNELSSVHRYDSMTGTIVLEYGNPQEVRADLERTPGQASDLRSLNARGSIAFEDDPEASGYPSPRNRPRATMAHVLDDSVGGEWGGVWRKTGQIRPSRSWHAFQGAGSGAVYLPIPFRCSVRVSYRLRVPTAEHGRRVALLLMADPATKGTGYEIEWLRILDRSVAGARPVADSGSRQLWRSATAVYAAGYKVSAKASAQTTSKRPGLSVFHQGSERYWSHRIPVASDSRGFVGFEWRDVEFEVFDLRVEGTLDKARAVSLLRARQGAEAVPAVQSLAE